MPIPSPERVAAKWLAHLRRKATTRLTDRVFWHGTYKDYDQIKTQGGFFWLALSRDIAFRYGNVHWRPDDSRVHLWEIRLHPSAKIVDLRDLTNPIVQKFRNAVNEARGANMNVGGPISEAEWAAWADFGIIEGYRWARRWLMQRKVDGVVVSDTAGGITPHDSVALFTVKVIASAERESLETTV